MITYYIYATEQHHYYTSIPNEESQSSSAPNRGHSNRRIRLSLEVTILLPTLSQNFFALKCKI